MLSEELPKQIELLVDTLRKQRSTTLSLTDVASVTEVLIATMQAFFRSIDTSIYRECRDLSEYITNARKEIASLQPGDLEEARIPRAGLELDAIVQQTEAATNTIMEAAEEIMGLDPSDTDAFQGAVNDNVMKIFEACSFQDITGQRIQKVVETLSHIEERVMDLRDLLGVTSEDIEEAKAAQKPISEEQALLQGPALEGEGIDQSEVDQLMGGGDPAPEVAPEPEPAPAPEAEAPQAEAKAPAPPPAPAPAPKVAPPPEPVDPKVLDNMFEEEFDPMAEIEAAAAEKAATAAEEAEAAPVAEADAGTPEAAADDEQSDAEKKAALDAEIDKQAEQLADQEEVSQDDIDALFG